MAVSLRPVFEREGFRESFSPLGSSEDYRCSESGYVDQDLSIVSDGTGKRLRLESPCLEGLIGFSLEEVGEMLEDRYGNDVIQEWEIRGYGNGWAFAYHE